MEHNYQLNITSTFNGRSTGSCICLRLNLYMPHVLLLCCYAYRLYLTCDMYKSSLRLIHDPVLLPLKVEVTCYINFLAYCLSYSAFFCFLTLRRLMSYIYIYIYIYIYMEHPFLMFLDHTQRRSTVGRTPLDE